MGQGLHHCSQDKQSVESFSFKWLLKGHDKTFESLIRRLSANEGEDQRQPGFRGTLGFTGTLIVVPQLTTPTPLVDCNTLKKLEVARTLEESAHPLSYTVKKHFNAILNNVFKSPGQPIGITVHFTQQPIREQSLSSQPSQKLFQTHHPDEAPKPRLPDPIDHPIAVMPPRRM
ncbi:hypothetical protein TNCV_569801 [Trichonephila clavipes]|nr:hypothetical protein TNCV_569801 [Trichonephila clavipes]